MSDGALGTNNIERMATSRFGKPLRFFLLVEKKILPFLIFTRIEILLLFFASIAPLFFCCLFVCCYNNLDFWVKNSVVAGSGRAVGLERKMKQKTIICLRKSRMFGEISAKTTIERFFGFWASL